MGSFESRDAPKAVSPDVRAESVSVSDPVYNQVDRYAASINRLRESARPPTDMHASHLAFSRTPAALLDHRLQGCNLLPQAVLPDRQAEKIADMENPNHSESYKNAKQILQSSSNHGRSQGIWFLPQGARPKPSSRAGLLLQHPFSSQLPHFFAALLQANPENCEKYK
jgi:hypothetical protein